MPFLVSSSSKRSTSRRRRSSSMPPRSRPSRSMTSPPLRRRPEHDVAGHVGELAVQVGGVAPRVAAEHGRGAAVGAQQAEQDADGRRLPRAVRAEEAVHLALADGEVEAVEGDGVAERLVQAGDGDDVGHVTDATPVSEVCECCNVPVCRPLPCRRRPPTRRSTTRACTTSSSTSAARSRMPACPTPGAGVRRADGHRGRPAHLSRARDPARDQPGRGVRWRCATSPRCG